MERERIVVFFDGVCGLCNAWVDFLLPRDQKQQFLFSPLQGEAFQPVLAAHPDLGAIDSLIVLHEKGDGKSEVLTHSDGPLFVLRRLGGGWSFLATLMQVFPGALRTFVYRGIAASRYRIFGKKETCRLPSPAERARFLA